MMLDPVLWEARERICVCSPQHPQCPACYLYEVNDQLIFDKQIKNWMHKVHPQFANLRCAMSSQGASQAVLAVKKPACQCRRRKRCGFDPWVGKIPWRRAWQPTPVFLPGESHGQKSLVSYKSIVLLRVRYDWSDLACAHTRQATE